MTKKKESVKHYLRNAAIMMVFLAITVCCFGKSVQAAGGAWEGSGTQDAPWLIEDEADLRALAARVNEGNDYSGQFFTLENSILCSNENWIPIGTGERGFCGIFNGNGCTVKIQMTGKSECGLFGVNRGTITNLIVDGYVAGGVNVGGIAGINCGTITDCEFIGSVKGTRWGSNPECIGGIVGCNRGMINNVSNYGTILTNGYNIGGIAGKNESAGRIFSCTNEGSISSEAEAFYVEDDHTVYRCAVQNLGGVVGYNEGSVSGCFNGEGGKIYGGVVYVGGIAGKAVNSSISNCTNNAKLQAVSHLGGIVGFLGSGALVTNCVNNGTIRGVLDEEDWVQCVGGIAGYLTEENEITDCTNTGTVKGWYQVGGIAGVFSNSNSNAVIRNCKNVGEIEGDSYAGGIVGEYSGLYLEGCESITDCTNKGKVTGIGYVGGIAGKYYKGNSIRNCVNEGEVTGKESTGGIVGYANSSLLKEDLEIANCTNTGKITGTIKTAGIAGELAGLHLRYNVNKGSVSGTGVDTGGIVGRYREGSMVACLNEGNVSGVDRTGGVGGYIFEKIPIQECGNTGYVYGEDGVGGVLGQADGTVATDCYNRGRVYGNSSVGGIFGKHKIITLGKNTYYPTLIRCYCKAPAEGVVSGTYGIDHYYENGTVGGLLGAIGDASLEDCYWWSKCAKQAFSNTKPFYELSGDGYTYYAVESRFSDSSNFEHWDFSEVWVISGGVPQLRKLSNAGGKGGTGGAGGTGAAMPIIIHNVEEFMSFAKDVNDGNVADGRRIYLDADLDLSGMDWVPIGGSRKVFNGIFDGRNHVIKGLRFDKDAEAAGLFGECGKKSGIRNLIVYGEVKNENEYTGGIAGRSSGEITNCQFYGNVSGSNRDGCTVGGIVGLNEGRVRDCLFSGSVSAKATSMNKTAFAGGIAGETKSGSVTTCMAFGTVSNDGYNESGGGGIVGFLRGGEVYGCSHVGNVDEDGGYGGGVVGIAEDRDNNIRMCFQYGEVNYVATRYVSNRVGGVLGKGKSTSLTDCFALAQGGLKILGDTMAQNPGTRCEMLFKEEFRDPDTFANWKMGEWCMGPDYPLIQRFCNCAQFLPNGGEGKAHEIGVLKGEYNVPEVPEKELKVPAIKMKRDGYYFIGWNHAQDGSGTYYYTGDVVPAGSKLYAQWAQPYQGYVPFKPESHVGDTGATYDMLFDNNLNTTWRISGLADDEKVSVEFATKDYVIPSGYGFVTGNASWFDPSRNPRNWKLEGKKSQDGEWVVLDEVYNDKLLSREAKTSASKTIRNAEEYCYFRLTFWGLNENNVFELSEFWLLTATTRLPKVTLVLDAEDEEAYLSQEGENLSSFQLPEALTEVNGYVLRGWNTQADGKGQAFGLGDEYQITGDATLYVFRELETYEITFDVTGADPIDPLEYTMESTEELPEVTKEEYVFDGWKVVSDAGNWLEEDELYAAGTVLTGKYGNVTLKAQWTAIPKYTVTWKNYDGEVIKTDENVIEGTIPEYEGDEPEREKTEEFIFTFIGWDKTPEAIEGDVEFTAVYQETKRVYDITWKMDDGTLIGTTTVEYGEIPTHEDVTKKATDEKTYVFSGWTPNVKAVEGDAEYKAVFSDSMNSYKITWLLDDGTLIDETTVEYGKVPTHADAVKKATAEFTYTFTGWDKTLVAVTGDAIYVATFNETKNSYKITWLMDDGSLLDETFVEYGEVPDHADAVKAETADYTYTFTGWDVTPAAVIGEATYKATFQENKKDFGEKPGEKPGEEPGGETPGEDTPGEVITNEYGDYLDELRARLQYAIALGGEQSVYWNKGTSLPKDVLKTLEDHLSITLVFDYVYDNKGYSVTMTGKSVRTVESIQWYGPLLLPTFDVKNGSGAEGTAETGTYVVKRGDTLSKIARNLHVRRQHLIKLNNIANPDRIRAGQVLKY